MRTSALTLTALMAAACAAAGQSGPGPERGQPREKRPPEKAAAGPKADSLEEAFETALQFNTDIKAAEFKLREAENQLQLVRQQVFNRIAILRQELASAEKSLAHAMAVRQMAKLAYEKGAGTIQDLSTFEAQTAVYEAAVAKSRAELDALTGKWAANALGKHLRGFGTTVSPPAGVALWDLDSSGGGAVILSGLYRPSEPASVGRPSAVEKPMADRIRAALNKSVKLDGSAEDVSLPDALNLLRARAGIDVPFRLLLGKKDNYALPIPKGELPVGAWLQSFEDAVPDVRFLVRDYGILVTTRSRTPDGAVRVNEFWKDQSSKPSSETPPPTVGR